MIIINVADSSVQRKTITYWASNYKKYGQINVPRPYVPDALPRPSVGPDSVITKFTLTRGQKQEIVEDAIKNKVI